MTHWLALGRTSSGVKVFQMLGDTFTRQHSAASEADLRDILNASDLVVRIGFGTAHTLPAPILPETGMTLPNWDQKSPPDVISGWVRLWIAGFLATHTDWDGVICVDHGDLTHWIQISANEAISAQTVLTSRLIASLGGSNAASADALDDTLSRPERLAAHLRTAEVANAPDAITGHLIGAELAATRPYWLGQTVAVISDQPEFRVSALSAQAVPCTAHSPDNLIKSGLATLARSLGLVT